MSCWHDVKFVAVSKRTQCQAVGELAYSSTTYQLIDRTNSSLSDQAQTRCYLILCKGSCTADQRPLQQQHPLVPLLLVRQPLKHIRSQIPNVTLTSTSDDMNTTQTHATSAVVVQWTLAVAQTAYLAMAMCGRGVSSASFGLRLKLERMQPM